MRWRALRVKTEIKTMKAQDLTKLDLMAIMYKFDYNGFLTIEHDDTKDDLLESFEHGNKDRGCTMQQMIDEFTPDQATKNKVVLHVLEILEDEDNQPTAVYYPNSEIVELFEYLEDAEDDIKQAHSLGYYHGMLIVNDSELENLEISDLIITLSDL